MRDPDPETAGECHRHSSLRPGAGERSVLARAGVDLRKRFKREKGRQDRTGKRWAQRGPGVDNPLVCQGLPSLCRFQLFRTMGRIEQNKKCMGARRPGSLCSGNSTRKRKSSAPTVYVKDQTWDNGACVSIHNAPRPGRGCPDAPHFHLPSDWLTSGPILR